MHDACCQQLFLPLHVSSVLAYLLWAAVALTSSVLSRPLLLGHPEWAGHWQGYGRDCGQRKGDQPGH